MRMKYGLHVKILSHQTPLTPPVSGGPNLGWTHVLLTDWAHQGPMELPPGAHQQAPSPGLAPGYTPDSTLVVVVCFSGHMTPTWGNAGTLLEKTACVNVGVDWLIIFNFSEKIKVLASKVTSKYVRHQWLKPLKTMIGQLSMLSSIGTKFIFFFSSPDQSHWVHSFQELYPQRCEAW